ncbi:MAG: PAS domain S-box protein [Mesorhizobium sp.]|nr:PAS domain S-box protein [Mesorhizobium sp.]
MESPLLFSVPRPLQSTLMGIDVLALIADSVICTDEEGRILLFNQAAEQSFGYSATEVMGQHVEMLLPERHRAEHAHQVRSFALEDSAENRLMGQQREVWGRRKNGEEFPAEATVSRHSVNGRMVLTVVHRDITERKQLEELHEAIEHELDHRIQNMFSVVSSLVSLSAKSASSVDEFRDSLQDRLRALAATQTFLRRGRRGSISLGELLLAELAHYRNSEGTNLIIQSAPVELGWSAAQTLALALHELATNSAKYGAFSDERGSVTVTSESRSDGEERLIVIEWRESGGPPVKPPSRQGFGTTLIEQVIKRTFQADIIVDYRPEGLVCRMTLPRAAVEAIPAAQKLTA